MPYIESVFSSYAADDSSVPLYYRMASYMAPPTSKNMDNAVQNIQEKISEVKLTEAVKETVDKPVENTVPLDYFIQNTQLQTEADQTSKAELAPVLPEIRISSSATKGFLKMQFANGEEASAYAFEAMDEKIFTDNYNTLDNVPTMSPRVGASEALVSPSIGSAYQAAPVRAVSFQQTGYNQRTGGYNNEESSYLSFQNDVTPAYGHSAMAARYNYARPPTYSMIAPTVTQEPTVIQEATVTQEPANQEAEPAKASASVSTASVEKSRFNQDQQGIQEHQMDLRLIGNAFRPAVLNAASEYQFEHLNDLVSMIR